jgi:hypothetical protein
MLLNLNRLVRGRAYSEAKNSRWKRSFRPRVDGLEARELLIGNPAAVLLVNGGPTGMIVKMMTPYNGGVFVTFVNGSTYYTPSGLHPAGGGDGTLNYSGSQHPVAMAAVNGGVLTAFDGGGIYFSPDGQNLGGGGRTQLLVNGGPTGMIVRMMTPYNGGVFVTFVNGSTYYTPSGLHPAGGGDGSLVYSGSQHPLAIVPYAGGVVTTFDGGGIYFSPNGQNLSGGGQTSLWGIDNVAPRSVVNVHGNLVTALSDGKIFFGGAPDWFDDHISDPALAAAGRMSFNPSSGSYVMTRNVMLAMFNVAVSEGSVSSADLSGLQAVVASPTFLNIPAYVENLAEKVVNGNPANARYQGFAMGNLTVGSPSYQLQHLVYKWFEGMDHPAAPVLFQPVNLPLYGGVGVPLYSDVMQGGLGDCTVMASMAEAADHGYLFHSFIANGDNTWTVEFFHNNTPDYVTVDNQLPAGGNYYAKTTSPGVLWPALLEKAYAQLNEEGWLGTNQPGVNSYLALNTGGQNTMIAALSAFTGVTASGISLNPGNLTAAVTQGKLVVLGTGDSTPSPHIAPDHAYAVIDYNSSSSTPFEVYNPWGLGGGIYKGNVVWGLFYANEAALRADFVDGASAGAATTVPGGSNIGPSPVLIPGLAVADASLDGLNHSMSTLFGSEDDPIPWAMRTRPHGLKSL